MCTARKKFERVFSNVGQDTLRQLPRSTSAFRPTRELEIDSVNKVFKLSFSGQMNIIKLSTVGATAGRFVLDLSNTFELRRSACCRLDTRRTAAPDRD